MKVSITNYPSLSMLVLREMEIMYCKGQIWRRKERREKKNGVDAEKEDSFLFVAIQKTG